MKAATDNPVARKYGVGARWCWVVFAFCLLQFVLTTCITFAPSAEWLFWAMLAFWGAGAVLSWAGAQSYRRKAKREAAGTI